MESAILLKGVALGFFMCAPVGPIGLLCVRRTLAYGRSVGFVSVLGAAAADGLYCSIAGFGITFVSEFLEQKHSWIELAGGIILVAVGMRILLSGPTEKDDDSTSTGLLAGFTSAFLLMLANPVPILIFTAVFTALGVHGWKGDYGATANLVLGVTAGSAIWAPILSGGVNLLRHSFHASHVRWINRIVGAMIAGFGGVLGIKTLIEWNV